jgi:acyl-CoA dehydrogenase
LSRANVSTCAVIGRSTAGRASRPFPLEGGPALSCPLLLRDPAQRVIDRAVQLHGGLGITKGVKAEELYREIRALRIYEGATEVQKIVIARETLKAGASKRAEAAE